MQIFVVTSNTGKYAEIRHVLEGYGIECEQRALATEEHGETLEERVLSKAEAAWQSIKKPLLVDDTGVFFEAVPGFPGAEPKKVFEAMGFEGLLKKLDGKSRRAYFLTLMCYMDRTAPMLFEGRMSGTISEKVYPASRPSLPYEQIFIPDSYALPLSQLSLEERSRISHRAEAARKCAEFILRKSLQ